MFSKELQQLDKNTVQYMIDEMQDTIDAQKGQLEEQKDMLDAQKGTIDEQKGMLDAQKDMIDTQNHTITEMQEQLEKNKEQSIKTAVSIMQELNTPESEILEKLQSKYQLTKEQAKEYLKK